ncbi:MAG: chemotaxis protein CheD [Planctomycetes bacterium]|nr:chemotaxis protein CheD [Planctomycetota bacterium]
MSSVAAANKQLPMVGMGQIVMVTQPEVARAVLGSCIGVTLYHPRARVGAMAHIVLPRSSGRTGPPGKFVNTAVPHMIELLEDAGAKVFGMVAKLAGGANMFKATGPMQVGTANIAAVRELLSELGIRIAGEHLGGAKGRRVTFDPVTGDVIVEIAGETQVVL